MMAKAHEAKSVVETPKPIETRPAIEWLDMPARPDNGALGPFPFNGEAVMLTPDGLSSTIARWRMTNTFDKAQKPLRWRGAAFWARGDMINQEIDFEPLGYRRMQE